MTGRALTLMNGKVAEPAYKQISAAERVFVEAVVSWYDSEAISRHMRIEVVQASTPIPDSLSSASRGMLDKPLVKAAIHERVMRIARDRQLTPELLLDELIAIARFNIMDITTIDGRGDPVIDLTMLTPEHARAIESISIEKSGNGLDRGKETIKIKAHRKLDAIKMLLDYMGSEAMTRHWQQDMAQLEQAAITSNTSIDEAGDAYAGMING